MSIGELERRLSKASDPSVGELVTRYGTNVEKLKMDASQGKVDPTKAMMAKMAIDRIVAAHAQPPQQQSFYQEQMTPRPPMPPQGQQAPAGLAAVPMNPQMFQGASGGIIAMAMGGPVPRYNGSATSFIGSLGGDREVDKERLRAYYLSKGLPLPEELKTPEERGVKPERGPAGSMYDLVVRPLVDAATTRSGSMNMPSALSDFLARKKAEAMGGAPSAEYPTGTPLAPQGTSMPTPAGAGPMENRATVSPGDVRRLEAEQAAAAKPPVRKPPAGLPAAAAAARPTEPSGLAAAQAEYEKTLETQRGEKPTAEGVLTDIRKFDKEFGVDREFFKNQAAALDKQKEALKGDRQEAANMRLLEAGFGILGGTSPYMFENIGKGASPALAGFASDIKDIKKQTRDLDKARQEYELAQQNAARSDSARAQQMLEKRADRYNALGLELAKTRSEFATKMEELGIRREGVQLQREQINKPSTFSEEIAALTSKDPKVREAAMTRLGVSKTGELTYNQALKVVADMPGNINKKAEDLVEQARALMRASSGSGALPSGVKFMGTRPQ